MRDPIIERLSRFTADGSGLDRDALLFAAGRASARPNRGWMLATGSLIACQLLTLTILWPRSTTPVAPLVEAPSPFTVALEQTPTDAVDLGLLSRQLLQSETENLPPPPIAGPMVPSDPPLYAFVGSIPADLE